MERLKQEILEYYWMAHYPNADYDEFKKTWLTEDNEAFINGLINLMWPYRSIVRRLKSIEYKKTGGMQSFGCGAENGKLNTTEITMTEATEELLAALIREAQELEE